MKKIAYCIMAGALAAFAAAGLAACGKGGSKRDRYTIGAAYHADTKTLTAEMKAEIANPLPMSTDEFKFQLWGNAFREGAKYAPVSALFANSAYYKGKSYGGMTVSAVDGAESFEVCGEDENILSVKLKHAVGAGKKLTLTFKFEVALAEINHRLGVSECGVNLANFYPALCAVEDGKFAEHVYSSNGDPFVSRISDFDVTLTVPESYTLISGFTAEEVKTEAAEEGVKAYHVYEEGVRDVAFVLGENFECVTDTVGDREVAYYYTSADTDPARTLKIAAESLAYYEEAFGGYDYPRYTVAMTGFVYGGMEFPALSMISSDLRQNEIPAVVAHETAHQWWYAMVGSDQYNCAWQDEGLAELSSALFLGDHQDYGTSYRDVITASEQSYRAFFSVYSQVQKEADTTMNRPLTAYSGDYEYRNIAYDKGLILFDRIREVMGERKFSNALKTYFKEYKGKIATSEDLVSCFEKHSGGIDDLFASFIEGRCVI